MGKENTLTKISELCKHATEEEEGVNRGVYHQPLFHITMETLPYGLYCHSRPFHLWFNFVGDASVDHCAKNLCPPKLK